MRRIVWPALILLMFPLLVNAQKTSALIGEQLDKQLAEEQISFDGTLPDAIKKFGDLTNVRIEVDGSVYDCLPWGELTTFNAKLEHNTLRQALDAITVKLGLQYRLADQAVILEPLPPLQRLGRRCTVEELRQIDLLRATPLEGVGSESTQSRLVSAVDDRLEAVKSPYAIENRAFTSETGKALINVPRNATLYDALEQISLQSTATWYPWGKSVVVLQKTDQIRMQLTKRITTRFNGDDVSKVLQELAERSGVTFEIDPGAIQKIAPQFRKIDLVMDNATIQQAMETICGFTGLGYEPSPTGVHIWNASPAIGASSPTTQPAQ